MLSARIELRGEELFCADTGEGGTSTVRPLTPEVLARLRGWAERYDAAVRSGALPPLVEIGREIAAFLDEGDRWLDRVIAGTGEIDFEIAVPGRPEERERILLDVPWELLAPNRFFLAADEERLFRIARRLGGSGEPAALRYRDLALLFMAAEVDGKGVLNYGQEEAAIYGRRRGSSSISPSRRAAPSNSWPSASRRTARSRRFTSPATETSKRANLFSPSKAQKGERAASRSLNSQRLLAKRTRSRHWCFCRPAAPASMVPQHHP
jgi:hypothetical protein